jgi:hypothetical protein
MFKKISIALVVAAASAAIAAATASATTIAFSPGGSITAASLGKITFTGGATNIRCNLTLSGSLTRSASASEGTSIGSITSIESASCEGARIRSINNLPYELVFNRLVAEGLELGLRELNYSVSVTIFGIVQDCTYGGTLPLLMQISAGVTGLLRILTNSLPKTAGGGSCAASVSWSGTFGLEPQQTVTLA